MILHSFGVQCCKDYFDTNISFWLIGVFPLKNVGLILHPARPGINLALNRVPFIRYDNSKSNLLLFECRIDPTYPEVSVEVP